MEGISDTALPLLQWGATRRPNRRIGLTAGALTCVFEPESGFLRYVRWGAHELIRGVYAAVRGPGWVTVLPEISRWDMRHVDGVYVVTYHAVCKAPPVWFEWDGRIEARPDDTIVYEFDGIARASFLRNRIGLCLLHPDTCAGEACTVEHVDGAVTHSTFPVLIAPYQPFKNIRAITVHEPEGIDTRVAFEGDVFEMEDQRNWTDASFKTYSTPLELPVPVEVMEETRVWQRITISARGLGGTARCESKSGDEVQCAVSDGRMGAPEIGLGVPWDSALCDAEMLGRLRELSPTHLRVELHLSHAAWETQWDYGCALADQLGVSLELAVVMPAGALEVIRGLRKAENSRRARVVRCFVLGEGKTILPHETFEVAAKVLRETFADAVIGAGTNRYFTELNRGRPGLKGVGAVVYSCNPQVHVFDNASIVETFAGQAWTVRTARSFCRELPVYISPITLKPRPLPEAVQATSTPPAWADARQASLFAAGFVLGSLAAVAEAGAAGVTLFEAWGWNGVMDGPRGGWLRHVCGRAGVYAAYHVLADLAERCEAVWHRVEASDPLRVAALALCRGDETVVLMSNLTADELNVCLACEADAVHIRVLDETTLAAALFTPEEFRAREVKRQQTRAGTVRLCLRPNAYVRVEW